MGEVEHPERMDFAAFLEPETFQSLVNKYSRMVFAVCRRMLGNDTDAQDITQECFEVIAQGKRAPQGVSAGAWLHGIAANRCKHRLRTEKRRVEREAAYVRENPPSVESNWDDIYEFLDEALAELPDEFRVPITASFFEGQSHRVIAQGLGVSRRTVTYRIARGIELLADSLRKRGAAVSVAALASTLTTHAADAAPIPAALQISLGKLSLAYSVEAAAYVPAAGVASPWLIAGGLVTMKKAVLVISVALFVAVGLFGGYRGWQYWRLPYKPKDITAESQFEVKQTVTRAASPVTTASSDTDSHSAAPVEKKETSSPAGEANSEPAAYGFISGIVLTEQGVPVPNARVSVQNDANVEFKEVIPKWTVAQTVTSDRYGQFQFDLLPLEPSWTENMPKYMITAEAGELSTTVTFPGDQFRREWYFELVLGAMESLSGIVVDDVGRPVENATLITCGSMPDRQGNSASALRRVRSDSNGCFAFARLVPGRYKLNVFAEGYSELLGSPWFHTGTSDIAIRLSRGSSISGSVTDAVTGLPLASYEVIATLDAPKVRGEVSHGREGSGQIDSSGKFVVTGLVPGVYELRLQAGSADDGRFCLSEPPRVDLTRVQSVTGLNLKAVKGGVLAGKVVDAETGQPVPGASVKAYHGNDLPAGSAESDESGLFRVSGLSTGGYVVKSECRNYEQQTLRSEVKTGEIKEGLVFRLPHLPGLRGRVIDETGRPVANASVSGVAADGSFRQVSGMTDESGQFEVYFAYKPPWFTQSPGAAYAQASADSRISPRVGPVNLRDPEEVVLKLASAGRIEGVVVDGNGNAVSRACIAAVSEDKSAANIMANGWGGAARRDDTMDQAFAMTGVAGNFCFDMLLPSRYELRVYLPTSVRDLPVATTHVSLGSGETLRAHLVIDSSAFGSIEGRVTMQGKPSPNQRVMASGGKFDWSDGIVEAGTDQDGHYGLDGIPAGSVNLTLLFEPPIENSTLAQITQRRQGIEVIAGQATTVDFDVPFSASYVEGIVSTNGVPEFSAVVEFTQTDPSGEPQRATGFTDSEGYYKVGLLEGTYDVKVMRIRSSGVVSTDRYATVQALPEQTVRLDAIFGGGIIDGTLGGLAEGERGYVALLPADVDVSLLTPQALLLLAARIIQKIDVPCNGPFRLQDVEPGSYLIAAAGVPRDANIDDPTTFLNAKLGFVPVEVKPGENASVFVMVQ